MPFLGCVAQANVGYTGISDQRPTGSNAVDDNGLVVAFDMSTETSDGLMRDFSQSGNDGRIMGTTVREAKMGQGRLFTTANDRIHLPENETLDTDGPLTLALWLRVDQLSIHQHILACDDKFALWVTPQNRVRFSDTLGHGMDSAAPIETGRWYALVAVWDGTRGDVVNEQSVRLYLDGSQIRTEIVNRTNEEVVRWMPGPLFEQDACYVGFESHQGNVVHQTLQFSGLIDELTIFRRALDDSEIRAHAGITS